MSQVTFSSPAIAITKIAGKIAMARVIKRRSQGFRRISRKPSITIWPANAPAAPARAVRSGAPSAFGLVDPENPVPGFLPYGNRVELFIGTFVGAITFSGSVIAFGKLSGKYKFRLFQGAPVVYAGQHLINLLLALGMLGFGVIFFLTQLWLPFVIMTLIAFVLGVLIIIPIGGADMPVVVSMLNSYSGWAAAGIGFSLNNPMLIIAGSLVGSSGAILSYIMCRAMNRSAMNVLFGAFGTVSDEEAANVKGGLTITGGIGGATHGVAEPHRVERQV